MKTHDPRSKPEPQTDEPMTYFTTRCPSTRATSCVRVSVRVAERYLALHHILPLALPEWPEDTLDELLEDLDPDKVETYEHALIMLAHHPSERAGELLLQIAQDAPLDLAPLAELAYAEQVGLRGMDYLKLREGHAPTIRPTTGG